MLNEYKPEPGVDRVIIMHEYRYDTKTHEMLSHKVAEMNKHSATGFTFTEASEDEKNFLRNYVTLIEDQNANA